MTVTMFLAVIISACILLCILLMFIFIQHEEKVEQEEKYKKGVLKMKALTDKMLHKSLSRHMSAINKICEKDELSYSVIICGKDKEKINIVCDGKFTPVDVIAMATKLISTIDNAETRHTVYNLIGEEVQRFGAK